MFIYLVVFFCSIGLFSLAEHFNKNKKLFWILCILAITMASFLAGMRDIGVGVDTIVYGNVAFEYAQNHSVGELLALYNDSPLFYLLWYYTSTIFRNIFAPMFVVEFVIEFGILLALIKSYKNNSSYHIWMGMMVYYFVFYCYSLNLMRQSITLAFMLIGYQYFLLEKKYIKYIIWTLFLSFIHLSALMGLLILFAYYIYQNMGEGKVRKRLIYFIFSFAAIFASLMLFTRILSVIATIFPRYSHYAVTTTSYKSTFSALILFLILVLWEFTVKAFVNKLNQKMAFYRYLLIIGIPLFLINLLSNNAYRLSFFCLYLLIIYYPYTFNYPVITETVKINSRILRILGVFVLAFFWYMMFVRWGTNNVIPYTSRVLGID